MDSTHSEYPHIYQLKDLRSFANDPKHNQFPLVNEKEMKKKK